MLGHGREEEVVRICLKIEVRICIGGRNFVHRVHRDLLQSGSFQSVSFWIKIREVFEFEVLKNL